LAFGELPRVFTFSNGHGEWGRDAIVGIFLDEDGRFHSSIKVDDLKDEANREIISQAIRDKRPDVIGVSGFSVQTNRLFEDLNKLVEDHKITVQDEGEDGRSLIEVIFINDEVARLYQHSDRAKIDHPEFAPLVRYCCALARYVQGPLLEYAALGRDVASISFHPAQKLLNPDKLWKSLEKAMVDMVNLCGVCINEAVTQPYVANLLPYVCGLGPRKASHVLKIISSCVSTDLVKLLCMKITDFLGRKNSKSRSTCPW
jgi:transcription elongation factor SPT6